MLDLSNLQPDSSINWRRIHQAGQRRVYLKVTEGLHFDDRYYARRRRAAHRAGLKTGGYHFSHSEANDPRAEARHFCKRLGRLVPGRDLRPCLDFEYGATSARWAEHFIAEVHRLTGVKPIIYSYADFLERSRFKRPPTALWLASYGRNDGKEHPYKVPRPWKTIVAHQFTSNGRVAGVSGRVDVSHVFNFRALELPSAKGV